MLSVLNRCHAVSSVSYFSNLWQAFPGGQGVSLAVIRRRAAISCVVGLALSPERDAFLLFVSFLHVWGISAVAGDSARLVYS